MFIEQNMEPELSHLEAKTIQNITYFKQLRATDQPRITAIHMQSC